MFNKIAVPTRMCYHELHLTFDKVILSNRICNFFYCTFFTSGFLCAIAPFYAFVPKIDQFGRSCSTSATYRNVFTHLSLFSCCLALLGYVCNLKITALIVINGLQIFSCRLATNCRKAWQLHICQAQEYNKIKASLNISYQFYGFCNSLKRRIVKSLRSVALVVSSCYGLS